jgi:hypothetical protein
MSQATASGLDGLNALIPVSNGPFVVPQSSIPSDYASLQTLKDALKARLAKDRGLPSASAAEDLYNQLSGDEKLMYVTFTWNSPDYSSMVHELCGTMNCYAFPKVESYNAEFFTTLQGIFTDYWRVIGQTINTNTPGGTATGDLYNAMLKNESVSMRTDQNWWTWYNTTQNDLAPSISQPTATDTGKDILWMLYGITQYLKSPTVGTVTQDFLFSNIRKLLQDPSSTIVDFQAFLKRCIQLDSTFVSTAGLPTNFDSKTLSQTNPDLRYFKYKCNYGFTAFKTLLVNAITIFQYKAIASATSATTTSSNALFQRIASESVNLNTNFPTTSPNVYASLASANAIKDLVQLIIAGDVNGICTYLNVTDTAQRKTIKDSLVSINTTLAAQKTNYELFKHHFMSLNAMNRETWIGWFNMLLDNTDKSIINSYTALSTALVSNDAKKKSESIDDINNKFKRYLCQSDCNTSHRDLYRRIGALKDGLSTNTGDSVFAVTKNAKITIIVLLILYVFTVINYFNMSARRKEICASMLGFLAVLILSVFVILSLQNLRL